MSAILQFCCGCAKYIIAEDICHVVVDFRNRHYFGTLRWQRGLQRQFGDADSDGQLEAALITLHSKDELVAKS